MKIRNNPRAKRLLLLASVLALAVAVVGGSLAWLTASSEPVVNSFTQGTVPIDIPEKFENGVKENVRISNDGNVDAYARAKIGVTWKSLIDEDEVSAATPVPDADYTMTMGEGWFQGEDGFWYCKAKVPAGAESAVLIKEAKKTAEAAVPEGFDLSVEILAQSIQADGLKDGVPMVVAAGWPVTVGSDGTLSAKS